MLTKRLLVAVVSIVTTIAIYSEWQPVGAEASGAVGLTGQVSSQEEGQMGGVLVGAKKDGSSMTVTVVSGANGRYSFPADRLPAGRYTLRIRAAGYDLVNAAPVEVTTGKATQLDLKLQKTKNLAAQLSNAEWLLSMPGTKQQKMALYNCVMCHSLERIVRSSHDVDEWLQTIARMNYYVGSTPLKPQRRPPTPPEEIAQQQSARKERESRFVAAGGELPQRGRQQDGGDGMEGEGDSRTGVSRRQLAEFLASVNLSKGNWSYELKTLPRPMGRATHVIYTTYELPRKQTMVHDADYSASDGMVWYTDFGSQFFGKLDPKTGKVTEYPVPVIKPGYPEGLMDIRFDKAGNIWMGMMAQAGIAKFDRKAERLETYPVPREANTNGAQVAMVMPYSSDVDGKVWMNNVGPHAIQRLDLKTGKMDTVYIYKNYLKDLVEHGTYGINADAQNNLFVNDIGGNLIVKVDAKTLESKFYETPTPNSGPRRGRMDSQYRLWIAESRADKFGLLDPKSGEIQEIASPTPYSQTYDIMPDKYGDV